MSKTGTPNRGEDEVTRPDPNRPDGVVANFPPDHVVTVAFDACNERCFYDISCLEWEEQAVIFQAVLDAEPDGRDAQYDAAEAALREMAVTGGWDQYLDRDD